MSDPSAIIATSTNERSKMTLEEYKQMVEAQRLASLAVALHALTMSSAMQKESESN